MIGRYEHPRIAAIFNEHASLNRWIDVERAVALAQGAAGVIPRNAADAIGNHAAGPDLSLVKVYERRRRHDVAGFVDAFEATLGEHGRWVHFGLTSSDVVDTANALALRDVTDEIFAVSGRLGRALIALAVEHDYTPRIGRTHGQWAESTTFGHTLRVLDDARSRATQTLVRSGVNRGKIRGPVGRHTSGTSTSIEHNTMLRLGLEPFPGSVTQIVPRDVYAQWAFGCVAVLNAVANIGEEIRHSARPEIGEMAEGFAAEQKGSSAMPHKRNPITSERLVGFARLGRGLLGPILEDTLTTHDRDIAHSSVERVALVDLAHLTARALEDANSVVLDLFVDPIRMRGNLEDAQHAGACTSEALLGLIRDGATRSEAYEKIKQG